MRKFVRKSAYLTTLDKHPSAIFGPLFFPCATYLEIDWNESDVSKVELKQIILGSVCMFA